MCNLKLRRFRVAIAAQKMQEISYYECVCVHTRAP
jgi:hypothetical protein